MLTPVLASAVLAAFAAGCSVSGNDGSDKAGGSDAPVVLRLAVADDAEQPDAPFARYFAHQVSSLSDGSVRVRVVWDAAGQDSPGYELGIARLVGDGDFELGWMGARAWDRMGIKSFQALQAPFLVTNHELLGRITTGPLAARMLSGLDENGFVGLALVPEHLRYAFGAKEPLASPDDFAGARVRVKPSGATDALMRALGATPVHISGDGVADAVANGEIDGAEASLGTNSAEEGETHLTANLPLFPKTLTLFAGDAAYNRLDEDQREAISKAARMTAAYAAAHAPSETALMRNFCSEGPPVSAVAASADDIAALESAAQPVYAQLERDPDTKAAIGAIRALKAASPAAPASVPPAACETGASTASGGERAPSFVNGTYHWRVTEPGARAAARAVGGSPHDEDVGGVGKMTLRDGRWLMGDINPEEYSGTYKIVGDRLVFDWGDSTLTFAFARDDGGTIQLKAVRPMNSGDAVVWAGGPWHRVGPPVRDIP
ncbi:MAG: TRAP transporter substrate-binding protein DctP [Thermoleophilaceae bacterium]